MIDERGFKDVLSNWTSGVGIVTSCLNQIPYGMTVSSFTSVSVSPLLISICVQNRYRMCSIIGKTHCFAVNILGCNQAVLAKKFSDSQLSPEERFEGLHWQNFAARSPIIPESIAWLDCKLFDYWIIGDHTIFVGQAINGFVTGESQPLLYYQRNWYKPVLLAHANREQENLQGAAP